MIECRTCGEQFDPTLKYHSEYGYVNQCGDCAREEGDDQRFVKAFVHKTEEGDFTGIQIVDNDTFRKIARTDD